MDYAKLTKDIAAKTTIEDSVEVLLFAIADELGKHPADDWQEYAVRDADLAAGLLSHVKALASAVVENT